MNPLSILCVLVGALIVAARGPLIVAPTATMRFYRKLLSTNARVRGVAVMIAPLSVWLIALPLGQGLVADILRALGWLWAAASLWLLAAPGSYRRLVDGVLDFFESSVDEPIIRTIGLVSVGIGIALIDFGLDVR